VIGDTRYEPGSAEKKEMLATWREEKKTRKTCDHLRSKTGEEERTRERGAATSLLYGLLSLRWVNERIPSGYLKQMVLVKKLSQGIQHVVKLLLMKPRVGCLGS
jgi:hypothetical protein